MLNDLCSVDIVRSFIKTWGWRQQIIDVYNQQWPIRYPFPTLVVAGSPIVCVSINNVLTVFQTPNGNVEAKVMCFFRRRDLPNTLIMLADKHQSEYTYTSCQLVSFLFIVLYCSWFVQMCLQYYILYKKCLHKSKIT